ncbi:beta-ketoacyl-[acyl-carrier-protein] synthase family protein [Cellvibrio mixtus]|uniref:beta-ketoacyl-[acyl-carrier-protein] synthase family protein n=1 Tax=Cellvibrio mixtus TaxID=39650 RepID=UPI000587BB7F|nr:beta-ketoacyl-[acyl-carrier-protein] synthase family protein [Cellvibrio mixtus]
MEQRVVVTGMGLICGQAMSAPALFERIKTLQSSVRVHPGLAAYGVANAACSYVDEAVLAGLAARYGAVASRCGPPALLALHAADQAVANAGLDLATVVRKGLFAACNKQSMEAEDLLVLAQHLDPHTDTLNLDLYLELERHDPLAYFHKRQDMGALALAERYGFDDVVMTPGDACAAGGISIGTAYRYIASGELDVALAGAAETMCNYMPMLSFSVLGALAPQGLVNPGEISRPFDKARSGFVMGDGSAFLVLESEAHARARGAVILGYISGFAKQTEAWRITSSPRDGSDYARCMQAAIRDAGLALDDIDHINAHGTSTEQNDSCESLAIKKLFAERTAKIPVTSNKSAIGHSLAASGAIEAAMSILSLQHQLLLPTLNYQEPDDDTADIQVVRQATPAPLRHVLSNSFGFGGENSALVLSAA